MAQDRKRGAVTVSAPIGSSLHPGCRSQHRRVGRGIGQGCESHPDRLYARRAFAPPQGVRETFPVVRQVRQSQRVENRLRRRIALQSVASDCLAAVEPGISRADLAHSDVQRRKGQRKIASRPVHARQHQAEHRALAAHAGGQGEAPDRRLQEGRQPGFAHQGPAARQNGLQPLVPAVGEVARQPDADEVAARRKLAEEADYRVGHWKSRRTPGANGFRTEPARISNEAWRSPSWKSSV